MNPDRMQALHLHIEDEDGRPAPGALLQVLSELESLNKNPVEDPNYHAIFFFQLVMLFFWAARFPPQEYELNLKLVAEIGVGMVYLRKVSLQMPGGSQRKYDFDNVINGVETFLTDIDRVPHPLG